MQFYDPRVWVREGEKTLTARVKEACADLGNVGMSISAGSPSAPAHLTALLQTDCEARGQRRYHFESNRIDV